MPDSLSAQCLTDQPWRNATLARSAVSEYSPAPGLPGHWVNSERLLPALASAHHWISEHPGQRYLLHSEDPLAFSAFLLALWEQGKVAVLPPDTHCATLTRLRANTDQSMPTRLPVTASSDEPVSALPGVFQTSQTSQVPDQQASRLMRPETIALELHTSGTSGEPLSVVKHFYQLEKELAVHAALWSLEAGCVISQVSHLHIYGLLTGILRPLCSQVPFTGHLTRFPELLDERLAEANQHSLTATVVSSPAQLSRMPALEKSRGVTPARIFSSGAPLGEADARRSESLFGCPVIEIYGSTETGGIATREQTRCTLWQPLPTVSVSESDGAMVLHSDFLEQPSNPWYQADRVRLQGARFQLLGRQDRLVKIAGKRLSMDRIEQLLHSFEPVLQARCVDLNPQLDRLGMVVAMAEVHLPHDHAQRQALTKRLREHLASELDVSSIPRYWRLVEQIPVNSQGKPDRQGIARLFADLFDRALPRWLGVSASGPDSYRCVLEVPAALASLEGHFDGAPIVPGIQIVQWACDQATELFPLLGEFRALKKLKFQQVLKPGQRVFLQLDKGAKHIQFAVNSDGGIHCTGQLEFTLTHSNSGAQ